MRANGVAVARPVVGAPPPNVQGDGDSGDDGGHAVLLKCGGCGAVVGRARFPAYPPFSSLSWELQTLLKPVIAWARRKAPPQLQTIIDAWRQGDNDHAVTVALANGYADGIRRIVVCTACDATIP